MPGGGFMPRLVVSADFGATRADILVPAPPHGVFFANAAAAANRSFWQGRRWVDTGDGDLGDLESEDVRRLAADRSPGVLLG